jgi:hypothetical protein
MPAVHPVAAAFLPNRADAVVTEGGDGGASLVMDVGGSALRVPLIFAGQDAGVFFSVLADRDRVFLAEESGAIAIVDLDTRRASRVSCECRPTGIHRMKGASVFRLNGVSSEPVMLLDAALSVPRIRVIPPSPGSEPAR